jgi:hypothetical protein
VVRVRARPPANLSGRSRDHVAPAKIMDKVLSVSDL